VENKRETLQHVLKMTKYIKCMSRGVFLRASAYANAGS